MSRSASARFKTITVVAFVATLSVVAGFNTAFADDSAAAEHVPGFDISWPQCDDQQFPPGPVAFAVIGLNDGRPYTLNRCFAQQYRWAQRTSRNPAIYINVDFPRAGRAEAMDGPYGQCAEIDNWCRAYNWGYGIGRDAAARVRAAGITPSMWWLDVEFGNYWSSERTLNAQVVRGVVDYMKEKRLPTGIYGTPYQWRLLAGSSYNPSVAIWTAGASGLEGASRRCGDSYAFGGGHVQMVQYETYGFDTNYICPGTALHLSQLMNSYAFGAQGRTSRGLTTAAATDSLPFRVMVPGLSN